ncbi:hypothetical protein GCM10027256_00710 [Novispirillum itersonii subsp. nipponicum]
MPDPPDRLTGGLKRSLQTGHFLVSRRPFLSYCGEDRQQPGEGKQRNHQQAGGLPCPLRQIRKQPDSCPDCCPENNEKNRQKNRDWGDSLPPGILPVAGESQQALRQQTDSPGHNGCGCMADTIPRETRRGRSSQTAYDQQGTDQALPGQTGLSAQKP